MKTRQCLLKINTVYIEKYKSHLSYRLKQKYCRLIKQNNNKNVG